MQCNLQASITMLCRYELIRGAEGGEPWLIFGTPTGLVKARRTFIGEPVGRVSGPEGKVPEAAPSP